MRRREFRELLIRVDEHIAQGNEHMARGNELMDEIREELRANREERAGFKDFILEERAGFKDFIQEQTLRMERAAEHQGKELAKIGEAMTRVIEHLDDMGDQVRANTRAVLQLLDRFEDDGGAAPA
jgi:hypothetical protein